MQQTPGASGRRRSQAERSEETRTRVVEAAARCIAENGLASANLARIAAEADLTTGAIQHQFGEKDAVLEAVVEHGFERMLARVSSSLVREASLEERLAAFVGALWEGYGGPGAFAGLEILLAMRGDAAFRERSLRFLTGVRGAIDRLWMGAFWDAGVPRASHVAGQRLLFTTLNGLALERALVPGLRDVSADLARLQRDLLALLGATPSRAD